MYKLKQISSDFKVTEIPESSFSLEKGKYLILRLEKEDWNTLSAIRELSLALGIDKKEINFAGTKDKNAITSQFVSVKLGSWNLESKFPLNLPKGITCEMVGYSNEPLSLGSLKGNNFEIVVRNLNQGEELIAPELFVNYFDEQRFSTNNVDIGRAIVKKDFKKVAELIDDRKVKEALEENKSDFVGAIMRLPKKLLMLYVHAYQSFLWNETVSRYLMFKFGEGQRAVDYSQGKLVICSEKDLRDTLNLEIPIVGALPLARNLEPKIREIIDTILLKEGISRFYFVIKQFSNMTPEGGSRKLVCKIENLIVGEIEEDDLNGGKFKQRVKFDLGKGSYATMAIRFLVSLK